MGDFGSALSSGLGSLASSLSGNLMSAFGGGTAPPIGPASSVFGGGNSGSSSSLDNVVSDPTGPFGVSYALNPPGGGDGSSDQSQKSDQSQDGQPQQQPQPQPPAQQPQPPQQPINPAAWQIGAGQATLPGGVVQTGNIDPTKRPLTPPWLSGGQQQVASSAGFPDVQPPAATGDAEAKDGEGGQPPAGPTVAGTAKDYASAPPSAVDEGDGDQLPEGATSTQGGPAGGPSGGPQMPQTGYYQRQPGQLPFNMPMGGPMGGLLRDIQGVMQGNPQSLMSLIGQLLGGAMGGRGMMPGMMGRGGQPPWAGRPWAPGYNPRTGQWASPQARAQALRQIAAGQQPGQRPGENYEDFQRRQQGQQAGAGTPAERQWAAQHPFPAALPPGMGGGGPGGTSGDVNAPSRLPNGQMPSGPQQVGPIVSRTLSSAGLPQNAIRGIMFNIGTESSFNPTLRHPDQPNWSGEAHYAHGLYQEGAQEWNNYSRWLRGRDWRDPQLQTEFLAQNIRNNYPRLWSRLQNAQSPEEAASLFARDYLKPARPQLNQRLARISQGI
jgi:hypothetical protein